MKIIFFVVISLVCIAPKSIHAGCTSEGKEFYVVFASNAPNPTNAANIIPALRLFLTTTQHNTIVEVRYGVNTIQNVAVNVGQVTTVSLPVTPCHLTKNRTIDPLAAIHLRSLDGTPFSAYGLNRVQFTTDGFTCMPVEALGTRYRIASYNKDSDPTDGNPEVAVVATEDSTVVTFNIPGATPALSTVTLKKRQAYLFQDPVDITGGLVTSNKPIAVFSGSQCTYVPQNVEACDHLIEQLLPTTMWGNLFYASSYQLRTSGAVYRVIADMDSTQVYVNGALGIINKGKFIEGSLFGPTEFYSSKPIQVVEYAKGGKSDNGTGDPFMMLLPPVNFFVDGYNFTTPTGADAYPFNYLTVIAPMAYTTNVRYDGKPVTAQWTAIPNFHGSQQFAVASVFVPVGSHKVSYNPLPPGNDRYTLSGYIYGWGSYDSYGYEASFGLRTVGSVNPSASFVVKPDTVNMGSHIVNQSANDSVYIKNTGTVPITVSDVHFIPDTFASLVTSLPRVVLPNDSLMLRFTSQAKSIATTTALMRVHVDSTCDDVDVLISITGENFCLATEVTSGLKPGEIGGFSVVADSTSLLKNTKTIDLHLKYDNDLLRPTGEVSSLFGTISNYTNDPGAGECSFTVTLNQSLPSSKATLATLQIEALLSTRAKGTITVQSSQVTSTNNQTISLSGCPAIFSLDSSCILPGQLRARSSARIEGIYPNPSHKKATIAIITKNNPQVQLEVYDVFGRQVEVLRDGDMSDGKHEITVSTENYATGIYFFRMIHNGQITTRAFNVER